MYVDAPTKGPFADLKYVVDCTELPLARPNKKELERACYSFKAGGCAIKYEGTIKFTILQLCTRKLLTHGAVATHIATGKFVWWAGGRVNVHDTRLFNECGLARQFPPLYPGAPFPKRGLADKGYSSRNPALLINQCLITPHKRVRRGEALTTQQIKENQVISSARIEVERSIGRLKFMKRLSCIYRGGSNVWEQKLEIHRSIFRVCIHLTNLWMEMRPMRTEPHWLLCPDGISEEKVWDFLDAFYAAPANVSIPDFLQQRGGMLL